MMVEVKSLGVVLGGRKIVQDVSFTVAEGQWLMVAGPNGAGKSTLVNAIGQSHPYSGDVLWCGKNIKSFKPSKLAQNLGILMQNNSPSYSFTVQEVVQLGRYPWRKGFMQGENPNDSAIVKKALSETGIYEIRHQNILTLSGGELQRTFLAQLFAQNPRLIILDEPANHLDLVYQKQVFALVGEWIKQPGKAAISVVHDLSLAKAYGSHTLLLGGGKTAAFGKTADVLNRQNLAEVYGMDVYGWMQSMLGQWQG